ncbi:class E sortase [Corynebacterium mastitidis]|uniref:class E sortase n=1 Tax=Corynebacterium mastitidis TaxID=161890 RepID=UPI0009FF38DA|nr:class E sortase [Corynebacterium mastitidis]
MRVNDASGKVDYSDFPDRSFSWSRFSFFLGEFLGTVFVIVFLFLVYVLWGTGVESASVQRSHVDQLQQAWGGSEQTAGEQRSWFRLSEEASEGDPLAILRFPAHVGGEYPMLKGIEPSTLNQGPGWYSDSDNPGEPGNVAVAAHRDGWNAPFGDLDRFSVCDPIVVETHEAIYTYRVLSFRSDEEEREKENASCLPHKEEEALRGKQYQGLLGMDIVAPEDYNVVHAVPGSPQRYDVDNAQAHILTLTTCHPHWSNDQRLIIHAALEDVERK